METKDVKVCAKKPAKRRLEISIAVKLNMKDVQGMIKQQDVSKIIQNHKTPVTATENNKRVNDKDILEKAHTWPRIDIGFKKDNELLSPTTSEEENKDETEKFKKILPSCKITNINVITDTNEDLDNKVVSNDTSDQKRSKPLCVSIDDSPDHLDKNRNATRTPTPTNTSVDVKENGVDMPGMKQVSTKDGLVVTEDKESFPLITIEGDTSKDGKDYFKRTLNSYEITHTDIGKEGTSEVVGTNDVSNDVPDLEENEQPTVNDEHLNGPGVDVTKNDTNSQGEIEIRSNVDIAIPKENESATTDDEYNFVIPMCKITNISVVEQDTKDDGGNNVPSNISPGMKENNQDVTVDDQHTEANNISNSIVPLNTPRVEIEKNVRRTQLTDNTNIGFGKDAPGHKMDQQYLILNNRYVEIDKNRNSSISSKSPGVTVVKNEVDMKEIQQVGPTMDIAIPTENGLLQLITTEGKSKQDKQNVEIIPSNENMGKQDNNVIVVGNVAFDVLPDKKEIYEKQHFEIIPNGKTPNINIIKEDNDEIIDSDDDDANGSLDKKGYKQPIFTDENNTVERPQLKFNGKRRFSAHSDLIPLTSTMDVKKDDEDEFKKALSFHEIININKIEEDENEDIESNLASSVTTDRNIYQQYLIIDDSNSEMDKNRNSDILQKSTIVNVEKNEINMQEVKQVAPTMDVTIPTENELRPLRTTEDKSEHDKQNFESIRLSKITKINKDIQVNNEIVVGNVASDVSPDKNEFKQNIVIDDGADINKSRNVNIPSLTPNVGVEKGGKDTMEILPNTNTGVSTDSDLLSLTATEDVQTDKRDDFKTSMYTHEETKVHEEGPNEVIGIASNDPSDHIKSTKDEVIENQPVEIDEIINKIISSNIQNVCGKDTFERTQPEDNTNIGVNGDNELLLLTIKEDESKDKKDFVERQIISVGHLKSMDKQGTYDILDNNVYSKQTPDYIDDMQDVDNNKHSEVNKGVDKYNELLSTATNEISNNYYETTLYLSEVRRHNIRKDDIYRINEDEPFATQPLEFNWEGDVV